MAGVGSLSRLQGAVRLCAEEMAHETQERRAGKTAAAKTAAARAQTMLPAGARVGAVEAAAAAWAAVAEEEEEALGAGAEATAGPHVLWSGAHPWRDVEAWRAAHVARDEAQREAQRGRAVRRAPLASGASAASGEHASGRRAAGGRAAADSAHLGSGGGGSGGGGLLPPPVPPSGAHPAHDVAHLYPERPSPPLPLPGLPQLVGRHLTPPALNLDIGMPVGLKPDMGMYPGSSYLPAPPFSAIAHVGQPGSPFKGQLRPPARTAPSPRVARDARLPAATPTMASEREREAGLGDTARMITPPWGFGMELELAGWGGSGCGSPLPLPERWLASGGTVSGSGPQPSHTRTELDAWRRKGPGGVGAGPVGVGVSPLRSPRTPRCR